MRFRIFTEPQEGATYDDQLAVALLAEELGFDAYFRSDHYIGFFNPPRPPRSHRRVDHARRPRTRHDPPPARHARLAGHVPQSRPPRDQRRPGRRDERRPGRARARRGVERPRARGVRHPVPRHRRALRPARRAARDHHRALDHADRRELLVRRRALLAAGLARVAQAGAAAAPADRHRRVRGQAHAAPRRDLRHGVQRRVRAADRVPAARRARPRRVRGDGPRHRDTGRSAWPTRWCAGPTTPKSPGAPPRSARAPDQLGGAIAGTPAQVIDTIGTYRDGGAETIYFQVLDLHDLDHIRLLASEVVPAFTAR